MILIIMVKYHCHIIRYRWNIRKQKRQIMKKKLKKHRLSTLCYCWNGGKERGRTPFSCSATVSNMGEMLTLMKSWIFFCHKLHMGCFCFHMQCKKVPQKTISKMKHKEKYCPYHLWTNFSIMSLEDERGRGELNVKGDKGIKNTFSTKKCQSL